MKASVMAMTILAAAAAAKAPVTEKKPVIDEIQHTKITDDYRWLENWDDASVKDWSAKQNDYARATLGSLPARAGLEKRLTAIESSASVDYWDLDYRKETLFAIKSMPPKQQPLLWAFGADEFDGPVAMTGKAILGHAVVDPNVIDPTGGTTIDFYVPSPDGKKIAVSLSKGGTESGDVHVFDLFGKDTGDVVPRVNGGTAGGGLAWKADGSGYWYTRYPRGTERPAVDMDFFQQVWFHALGQPTEKDVYAIGKDFPRIAEVKLSASEDGGWVLATVANGDGGEYSHWLCNAAGKWTQLTAFADKIVGAKFGPKGRLYLVSRAGAPRGKILELDLVTPTLAKAKTVVESSDPAITDLEVTATRLYVNDLIGGPSQVRIFDLEGKAMGTVPLRPLSAVEQVVALDGDDVLFRDESYLEPAAWFRYSAANAKAAVTSLKTTSPATFGDAEVIQEFATSKDGTKVPMLVLRMKGTRLDGKNPTLLYGYGGYGVPRSPQFIPWIRPWLEQGGIYVASNLRGGSEYGEEWHLAGNLTRKQNVFDDFEACARQLIHAGYTSPSMLAAYGRSNGGLLMGAALTQHPELYKAVIAKVGIYDMLRVELSPNGAFNVTEFGTVKDPAQFEAMYAYSPYHRVKDGTKYPAVLFMTGASDPRVDPMQSRKMTARLQAATSGKGPILLRTSAGGHGGGHGNGTALDERVAQDVDMFAFLMNELGMKYRAPAGPKS